MSYDQTAARNHLRGKQNRAQGESFEKYIEKACDYYRCEETAFIEKTPEPFKVIKPLGEGKFAGCFRSSAQPDYKGTLYGGTSICFDAKSTSTEKILISALTEEQRESLELHYRLGAEAYVLCCWGFRRFAMIPITIFLDAKTINGHKSWTADEAEMQGFEVFVSGNVLDFLSKVGNYVQ